MLHAVIMAGGAGTRFWPASRADRPKQLLSLVGSASMIRATVDRLEGLVPAERTLVVTNHRLVDAIAHELPELAPGAIIGEPCKRDTAPCIGLAAMLLNKEDPDATMVVMPADHVIPDADKFRQAVQQAATLVDQHPRRIVTFGIRPTYAAEIFGYIQRDQPVPQPDAAAPTYRVAQFREKPPAEIARHYLQSGNFYWNSGIFVWKAATILDQLAGRQPEMTAHLQKITAARGQADFAPVFSEEFAAIQGTSIDYAVMEHAADVVVIEAPFAWDDVGSWQSLSRLLPLDPQGNVIDAKHLGQETTGCVIRAQPDHLVVTLGISDLIIVQTPDATLVANKNDEESIRRLVQEIEDRGWTEHL
ncbi:MAG: NTP transferase domain-containing protein [Planctomycetales bacterium]|nr:NTP transferase domain-containing protein [Planctomycetales bacterium]NIM07902.1 NTP transferase domain-containing protein [Planctomycetales bacterium]NIN07389.1 NTP transferase domain-containing protein [Planctomycetales bacterium]NIN76493.1 NTP transferase domain-containing protein [Planctomycetales bacterium]NIO33683.1 NTP transferase domain-containing protein [Planctomycetales bacterium]